MQGNDITEDLKAVLNTWDITIHWFDIRLYIWDILEDIWGFPGSSVGEESTCNAGDWFNSWVGKILWRRDRLPIPVFLNFPGGSNGKKSACKAGDLGLITGLGRSPGGGHSSPLQYTCLENPHGQRGLASYNPWGHKDWTWLND